MTCKHEHGSQIDQLMGWLCGQCFKILPERPKRYGMITVFDAEFEDGPAPPARQEVVWQAGDRVSAEGTTLAVFLAAVADRFETRGGLDKEAAYLAALEAIKALEVEFANPSEDWSIESAHDTADEEMSYWDNDGDMKNA